MADYPFQLERLEQRHVVTMELHKGNKLLEISEACDGYYSELLHKKEVGALIEELTVIHAVMED